MEERKRGFVKQWEGGAVRAITSRKRGRRTELREGVFEGKTGGDAGVGPL